MKGGAVMLTDREPIIHDLKCWPEYFQAVKSGEKSFEIRKWDRPYRVGDTLILREYDPQIEDYTGDSIKRKVTYLFDMTYLPGDNIPHFAGYVVLGVDNPHIASLQAENERLAGEVAAAVEDLKGHCPACKHYEICVGFCHKGVTEKCRGWQWRGGKA